MSSGGIVIYRTSLNCNNFTTMCREKQNERDGSTGVIFVGNNVKPPGLLFFIHNRKIQMHATTVPQNFRVNSTPLISQERTVSTGQLSRLLCVSTLVMKNTFPSQSPFHNIINNYCFLYLVPLLSRGLLLLIKRWCG